MNTQKKKYFDIYKNAINMISLRKYIVDDKELNLSLEDFQKDININGFRGDLMNQINLFIKNERLKESYILKPTNVYDHSFLETTTRENTKIKKRCIILYILSDKNIDKDIKQLISRIIYEFYIEECILISEKDLNSTALREFSDKNLNCFIQFFFNNEMIFNCIDSIYGSEYIVMSLDESKDFLDKNSLKSHQLPSFCIDSPVVKYYGVKYGQIIKCIRKSMIEGFLLDEEVFYRIVTKKSCDIKK